VTSLLVALKNSRPGKTEIVDLLLSAPGINVNARDNTEYGKKYTPLHVAAQLGRPEIAKLLLKAPVEINALDDTENTPLLTAISSRNTEIVKMLLKVPNVDVKKGDKWRQTPLELAARKGLEEIVELLKVAQFGNDVNSIDDKGNAALHRAVEDRSTQTVEGLLQKPGVDVNIADKRGQTPLHLAAFGSKTQIAKELLEMPKINVNVADNDGGTALLYAAYQGEYEIVELLLEMPNIDVNLAMSDGQTALYFAIWKKQTEVVKLLLGKDGINVNTITDGKTPLHLAGLYGKADIVEMLLRTPGVEVNKKNTAGKTPLQYRLSRGAGDSDAIVMMLKAAGGV